MFPPVSSAIAQLTRTILIHLGRKRCLWCLNSVRKTLSSLPAIHPEKNCLCLCLEVPTSSSIHLVYTITVRCPVVFLVSVCFFSFGLLIPTLIARYWEDPYAFKPWRFLKDWPREAFLPFSAGAVYSSHHYSLLNRLSLDKVHAHVSVESAYFGVSPSLLA